MSCAVSHSACETGKGRIGAPVGHACWVAAEQILVDRPVARLSREQQLLRGDGGEHLPLRRERWVGGHGLGMLYFRMIWKFLVV